MLQARRRRRRPRARARASPAIRRRVRADSRRLQGGVTRSDERAQAGVRTGGRPGQVVRPPHPVLQCPPSARSRCPARPAVVAAGSGGRRGRRARSPVLRRRPLNPQASTVGAGRAGRPLPALSATVADRRQVKPSGARRRRTWRASASSRGPEPPIAGEERDRRESRGTRHSGEAASVKGAGRRGPGTPVVERSSQVRSSTPAASSPPPTTGSQRREHRLTGARGCRGRLLCERTEPVGGDGRVDDVNLLGPPDRRPVDRSHRGVGESWGSSGDRLGREPVEAVHDGTPQLGPVTQRRGHQAHRVVRGRRRPARSRRDTEEVSPASARPPGEHDGPRVEDVDEQRAGAPDLRARRAEHRPGPHVALVGAAHDIRGR